MSPKNNTITKTAKSIEERSIIAREIALLKILEKKCLYPIPKIINCLPSSYSFTYREIPGKTLTSNIYKKLSSKQKSKLALELAKFVVELHTTIPPEFAKSIGFTETSWPMSPILLQKYIPSLVDNYMNKYFKQFLSAYTKVVQNYMPVFLHHDLHGNNILIHENTAKLKGIIDFEDAAIGDPFQEFRLLYKVNVQLMEETAHYYAQLTNKKYDRLRVHIYYLATEYSRIVEISLNKIYKQMRRTKRTIPEVIQRIQKYIDEYPILLLD